MLTAMRILFALAEPEVPSQWWFIVTPIVTALVGALVTVSVMRYREGPTGRRRSGELIPKTTVDLLLSAKDAEITGKDKDIERWMTAYHVADAARQEMAKSIDDISDAVELLANARQVRQRAHEEPPNGRQQRR